VHRSVGRAAVVFATAVLCLGFTASAVQAVPLRGEVEVADCYPIFGMWWCPWE